MAEETGGNGGPGRPSAEVKKFSAAGRGKKCPMCGQPVAVTYRPFCSRRCADLDLGRWLREDYRIPAEEPPDSAEEDQGPDADEASRGRG
jgi:endogenous inhibitor of DNA gyrase (YacG/DUF329 family)